jgi:hypothetical protein
MASLTTRSVLLAYLIGGLILGLSDAELGRLVQRIGIRPGFATALSVNILLPIVAIGLGVAVPLVRTAWLGAVSMTLAYIVGLAVVHPPRPPVNLADLPRLIPPVLVMACAGYGILGSFGALVTRSVSKANAIDSPNSGT